MAATCGAHDRVERLSEARNHGLLDGVELGHQFGEKSLATVVRNIRLRRELAKLCPNPHLNFWRVLCGNCTDTAVQDWCKLFGADGAANQALHWKNVAADVDRFRQDLLGALGLTKAQWQAYWNEMKTYRDQAVAHFDPKRVNIKSYPEFDLALESAYFYHDCLRAELAKIGVTQMPVSLRDYGDDFAAQSHDIAKAALSATESRLACPRFELIPGRPQVIIERRRGKWRTPPRSPFL